MQKKIGLVLLGVGAFLLVVGILCTTWAPGVVKKTPLDTESVSYLTGTADKLNPKTGDVESLDVQVKSDTRTDADKSDDDVVSWITRTCAVIVEPDAEETPDCVDDKDPRHITASVDIFASDRYTAIAVNDEKYLTEDASLREGVINKFPFDTEQKDYDYWDGMLGRTVEAKFEDAEDIDGLETYRFNIDVPETEAEVVKGIDGLYSMDKTIWIEPRTGSVIKQAQHETRTTEEGDTLLDMEIEFTDESVENSVEDSKANVRSLDLVTKVLPLIGFIGGAIALIAGAALVIVGRRKG